MNATTYLGPNDKRLGCTLAHFGVRQKRRGTTVANYSGVARPLAASWSVDPDGSRAAICAAAASVGITIRPNASLLSMIAWLREEDREFRANTDGEIVVDPESIWDDARIHVDAEIG